MMTINCSPNQDRFWVVFLGIAKTKKKNQIMCLEIVMPLYEY